MYLQSQESWRKISEIIWRVGKYMMVKRCLSADTLYRENLCRILRFLLDSTASFYFPFGITF